MMKFTEKVRLRTHDLVMKYRGKTGAGKPFFAYLLCNEKHILQINKDYETKTSRNIWEYGCKVLYIDHIAEEDEKAKNFLNEWLSTKKVSVV